MKLFVSFTLLSVLLLSLVVTVSAQSRINIFDRDRPARNAAASTFDGLAVDQTSLHLLSNAQTRSISPENFTGEKGKAGMSTDGPAQGAARDLGQGWKVSPFVHIPGNSTFTLAEIHGSGAIQQIWLTPAPLNRTREMIIRFYWDGEETPSVECPLADFFCCG